MAKTDPSELCDPDSGPRVECLEILLGNHCLSSYYMDNFAFFVFGSKTVVGDVVEQSLGAAFVFDLGLT